MNNPPHKVVHTPGTSPLRDECTCGFHFGDSTDEEFWAHRRTARWENSQADHLRGDDE